MHSMASDDAEITLGVGKLLGLFFLLAAICGVFFSIGYSLGKSSGREQAANDQPSSTVASSDATASNSGAAKPSAALAAKSLPSTADQSSTGDEQNLTFYKAVQQNDTGPQAPSATAPAQASNPQVKVVAATATAPLAAAASPPASSPPATPTTRTEPPVLSHTSPVTGPGTFVVQIAAVSREDDAVALAGALRKKDYNVFVVNNPVTNDKLYHVQVGPFSTLVEAEAMKAKLVQEGYNPIVKR
jgi:cell division septation protein DedD